MFTTLHHLHVNYNWNYSIVYIDCFTLCKHACVHSAIVTCTCTCTCTCMYVQCIPYSTRGNCAKNCVCRFLLPVSRKCNCYTLIHHLDISIDHQFKFRFNSNFATCEEQLQFEFIYYSMIIINSLLFIIYSFIHLFVNAFIYKFLISHLISLIAFLHDLKEGWGEQVTLIHGSM